MQVDLMDSGHDVSADFMVDAVEEEKIKNMMADLVIAIPHVQCTSHILARQTDKKVFPAFVI